MKQLLLSIISCVFFLNVSAQITIHPSTVRVDVDPMAFETVAHSMFTNNSDTTKTFRWRRSVEDITMGWQSAICDINACYSVEADTTDPSMLLKLGPGDSTLLDVHIRPNGLEGAAIIKVTIEDVDDPENTAVGEYLFNQTSPVYDINSLDLKLYPNPATHYFQLSDYTNVGRVSIYSMLGKEIRKFNVYNQTRFDLTGMQDGIYLVRMFNHRGRVLKTSRLRING